VVEKHNQKFIRWKSGGIPIIYEDRYFIAVDKPVKLLTVSTGRSTDETLYRLINNYFRVIHRREHVFIVHRLDRDTSGIIVFAKSERDKNNLQDSWQTLVEKKVYTAVVEGRLTEKTREIRSFLAENKAFKVYSTDDESIGKEAITHVECIKSGRKYSLLKILIETGRKNQIRVHLSDIGHPVVGDKKYGSSVNPLRRLCLHATELSFIHPVTKQKIALVSPPPVSFERLVSGGKE
jgi:23S rRNA pseudouridine1911/1915/1917 synthase